MSVEARTVAGAMATWLSEFHWDWFVTVTFRPRRAHGHHTLAFCKRLFRREVVGFIDRALVAANGRAVPRCGVFVAYERHRKGDPHAHCLVSLPLEPWRLPSRFALVDREHPFIGWTRAFPVSVATIHYVTKYAAKEACDFDVHGHEGLRRKAAEPRAVAAAQPPCQGSTPLYFSDASREAGDQPYR